MNQSAAFTSPFDLRGGLFYKREDAYRQGPVNGAKLRACQHLIEGAKARGAVKVISAASILSPQNAMAAVVAAYNGMSCHVIIGATKPATALKKPAIRIAEAYGAVIHYVPVGYNPYLQARARQMTREHGPAAYHLPYGITTPPDATPAAIREFLLVGAAALDNMPRAVRTLVVPFGSGNTAAGLLYGLARDMQRVQRVVLVGIGPSRLEWLEQRLAAVGVRLAGLPVEHIDLHGTGYATYQDKMPEARDGIIFHPTYEGKVVRYLDAKRPAWWTVRDGSACLFVVGGPLRTTTP